MNGVIYIIKNLINGKIYIGQTRNFKERCHSHKYNKDSKMIISKAIKKYGFDNFKISIIESNLDIEFLDEKEKFYIKKYNSQNKNIGYNLDPGGCKNKILSEEHKNNISLGVKKAISLMGEHPNKGKKRSDEHKKKLSEINSGNKNPNFNGKLMTKEVRKKISENNKWRCGEKNSFFNKKHTKESIEKNRITQFKKGISKKSTTGVKGVCFCEKIKKYKAIFNRKFLGLFENKIEAAKIWDDYAIKQLGVKNVTTNKDLGLY